MDFNGTTHVIDNHNGTFSAVGAVPATCLTLREPTRADVLGGRIVETSEGRKGWTGRAFKSAVDVRTAVLAGNGKPCTGEQCACRRYEGWQ